MTIDELPDYPAIEQINKALWRSGKTLGAAVLVGAGFSRNAERIHDGAALPPDWRTLTAALQAKLGYESSDIRDPLRTAEEFIASLGRGALDSVVKELVPDDQWLPGELHKKLVALNWVDILTTNWDTLLERAGALNLGQSYDAVRCLEDLATTRAPRIVKLHGSLPANRPFILSEDDYRTYPKRFAPFVNLVQQVLLENELCLLGFSGDDPNFLQWTGWIRDHLGSSARRIYLVGVLNLRPAQRRLLEQRNISAVDLAPLVVEIDKARKHYVATESLLDHFANHKPRAAWEWTSGDAGAFSQGNSSPETIDLGERFKCVPDEWSDVRREYPGWAVCPTSLRDEFRHNTFEWLQQKIIIEAATPTLRGQFAYEATWRVETGLFPISGYEELLSNIVGDDECWTDLGQRDFVIGALLRSARERRSLVDFEKWSSKLATRKDQNADAASEMAYQHALWARDELDFVALESRAPLVEGKDPLWKLRKAALYAELGEEEVARNLATEALLDARTQYLRDRDSIWALSRFAWARNLAPQYRDWKEMFKSQSADMHASSLNRLLQETKCDPWDWLTALDERISTALGRLEELVPGIELRFDAGTYRNRGQVVHFGQWHAQSLSDCARLNSIVGIPARTNNHKFLSDRMERADPLGESSDDADFLRILWTIQSDGEQTLERHFSRLAVAQLHEERVDWLLGRLSIALTFGLAKLRHRQNWGDQFWSRRCSHYAELISRLVVRVDETRATTLLSEACAYGRDLRWHSPEMFHSLEHLIERSLTSVSPGNQRQFLCELLSFPIPDEIGLMDHLQNDWPEASPWLRDQVLVLPSDLTQFNNRVEELTQLVRTGTLHSRSQAANRLVRLKIGELLSAAQLREFSDALWVRRSVETGLPTDTLLYPHVFLDIPSPANVDTLSLIKDRRCIAKYSDYLITLANASKLSKLRSRPPRLLFGNEEAKELLRSFLAWGPTKIPQHDLNRVAEDNRRTAHAIGTVIADQIIPVLAAEDLSVETLERIVERARTLPGFSPALPEVLRLAPASVGVVVQRILDAMLSSDSDGAWCGFNALYRWLRGWQGGVLSPLPRKLIEGLLWIVDTRTEPGRLHALVVARHLVPVIGALEGDDFERLNHSLALLYEETAYETAASSTSLTMLRSSCLRLASAMKDAGQALSAVELWLALAGNDRLPEVRYALQIHVE